MFNLTYSVPHEVGTIKGPPPKCLGKYKDYSGKRWDVWGYGNDEDGWWAIAAENIHPYFNDTSGASYGLVMQTWKPYRIQSEKV